MLPSGAAGEGGMEDVSLAQLQEMRERSKVLREQVLQVQRTVQTKVCCHVVTSCCNYYYYVLLTTYQ